MNSFLYKQLKMSYPFVNDDDVEEAFVINEWDLLIKFKDGRKIIYDSFYDAIKGVREKDDLSDEEICKIFSQKLKIWMNRRYLTQEELAERLGTSQQMISRYMTGDSMPSYLMLKKIAKVLKCRVDDLYYEIY